MKLSVNRKAAEIQAKKDALDRMNEIEEGAETLEIQLIYGHRIMEAREHLACARIQGVIRGFLSRLLAAQLRIIRKAVILLQSLLRGRLGRKRWMYEYWKKISVVKSNEALIDLKDRSTMTRESVSKVNKQTWQEYFDPLTNSFWYYDPNTGLNTWSMPVVFQKEMVCMWDGFKEFGGLPSQKKCRCIFDSMIAYQNHLRTAHRWYCAACDSANSGIVFPVCSTCGNKLSEDGVDATDALHQSIMKLQSKMYEFVLRDKADQKTGYNLKNRVIEKTLANRLKERLDEVISFTMSEEVRKHYAEPSRGTFFGTMLTSDERQVTVQIEQDGIVETIEVDKDLITVGFSAEKGHGKIDPLSETPVESEVRGSAEIHNMSAHLKSSKEQRVDDVLDNNQRRDGVSLGLSGGQVAQGPSSQKLGGKKMKKIQNEVELAVVNFHNSSDFLYDYVDEPVRKGAIPATEFDSVINDFIDQSRVFILFILYFIRFYNNSFFITEFRKWSG